MPGETATSAEKKQIDGPPKNPNNDGGSPEMAIGLPPKIRGEIQVPPCAEVPAPTLDWQTVSPGIGEIISGIVALMLWLTVFGFGMFVPTGSLRNALVATYLKDGEVTATDKSGSAAVAPGRATQSADAAPSAAVPAADAEPKVEFRQDLSAYEIVWFLAVSLLAFTISNVFFMCVISAYLGCMAFRWSTPFTSDGSPPPAPDEQAARRDVRRAYTLAILRGFLVYVLSIAGYLVVVPESSLSDLTMGQYARLAGALCAVSFLVGYEPRSIARLLSLVFAGAEKKPAAPGKEKPGATGQAMNA